jgi:hypothetical protein
MSDACIYTEFSLKVRELAIILTIKGEDTE